MGVDAMAIEGDVTRPGDVRRMVAAVVERFGALDVFVNNAGIQTWTPFLDVTEDEWDRVIDTNLKGCFLGTQAAARYMKDHGGGAIVNIGSDATRCRSRSLLPTRRARAASRCSRAWPPSNWDRTRFA
jgi:NAD(P)-dependent dehydrogenase (short-subunit alcohol dehydrogenase family)